MLKVESTENVALWFSLFFRREERREVRRIDVHSCDGRTAAYTSICKGSTVIDLSVYDLVKNDRRGACGHKAAAVLPNRTVAT